MNNLLHVDVTSSYLNEKLKLDPYIKALKEIFYIYYKHKQRHNSSTNNYNIIWDNLDYYLRCVI
jgi:hypothetical protein